MSNKKNSLESLGSTILDILKFYVGDPTTRIPKLLIITSIPLIASPWWQPFIQGFATQWLKLPGSIFEFTEITSFISGWVFFIVGISLYIRATNIGPNRSPKKTDQYDNKSQIDILRQSGARIEIILLFLCRLPSPSILLGQSPYHSMWMPPQEGVNLNESFEDAMLRCMKVECGLDIPKDRVEFERTIHLRSIRYVGTVDLPPQRHGERPVVLDAAGTVLEDILLTKKAYWIATIILANQNDIKPVADGRELLDFRWYSFADAKQVIRETNHEEKAKLLISTIESCLNDLNGAPIVD